MPGYIPKEQLDAYRRWQADSFDAPAPAFQPALPEPAAPPFEDDSVPVAGIGLPTAEDIERIHNEAQQAGYQAGFGEGRQEGYQAGLAAAQGEVERMKALADNLQTALAGIDQALADEVLALALEVSAQVLRGTVKALPEALLPVIREAIAALPINHEQLALYLNPADADTVREQLGETFSQSGWRIVEDRGIEAGGCLLKAGSSEVDATLATRWKRVLEAIGTDPSSWLPSA